ncbi:hypothetical protein ACHAQJ_000734 [Trichoderma viride]
MESLADVGLTTIQRFKLLADIEQLSSVEDQSQEWSKDIFLAQFDRFELWAVNLGVFVIGHGSLDYRIRDSESMKEGIYTMMKNLNRSLDEVLDYLNGNIEQGDEDSDTDSEMGSDMELLLDSIKDPIDRLYKLAVWIRNPATRLASSRARNFKQVDEESNVDLFESFENYDYDYVSSLFLEYEKHKAIQENPTVEHNDAVGDDGDVDDKDQVWEPIRKILNQNKDKISNGAESYLVGRIALANGHRRRQFAYWRKHKDKLREHASVIMEAPAHKRLSAIHIVNGQIGEIKTSLSVTTATQLRLLQATGKEIFEKEGELKLDASEYAPSAWDPSKDIVSFPSPPKISETDNFFECPYCYTICPVSVLSEKAWRAHLIRDLRPYICTYEQCLNSEQMYDTRDEWIQHETSTHQKIFQCSKHEEEIFTTLVAYEEHTQDYHENETISPRFAKSAMRNVHRSCPVCSIVLGSIQKLQSHIALHLERFAVFSLPQSVDTAEKNDAESQSDNAHLESDRSLNVDLDADSSVASVIGETRIRTYPIPEGMFGIRSAVLHIIMRMGDEKYHQNLDEREDIYSQLKTIVEKVRTWDIYEYAIDIFFNLGDACIKAGLVEEAIIALERLKFLQSSRLENDDPELLETEWRLAQAYEKKGSPREADGLPRHGIESDTESEQDKALELPPSTTKTGLRPAAEPESYGQENRALPTNYYDLPESPAAAPQNAQVSNTPGKGRAIRRPSIFVANTLQNPASTPIAEGQQSHEDREFIPNEITTGIGDHRAEEHIDSNAAMQVQMQNEARDVYNRHMNAAAADFGGPENVPHETVDKIKQSSFNQASQIVRDLLQRRAQQQQQQTMFQQKPQQQQHQQVAMQEEEKDRNAQEDRAAKEEREQLEEEIQEFDMYCRVMGKEIKEMRMENEEAEYKSEAQDLTRRMGTLRSEVEILKDQYAWETQRARKTEKASALSNKMREMNYVIRGVGRIQISRKQREASIEREKEAARIAETDRLRLNTATTIEAEAEAKAELINNEEKEDAKMEDLIRADDEAGLDVDNADYRAWLEEGREEAIKETIKTAKVALEDAIKSTEVARNKESSEESRQEEKAV